MKDAKSFVAKYVIDQLALQSHTLSVVDEQLKDADVIGLPIVFTTLSKISEILHIDVAELRKLSDSESEKANLLISAAVTETLTGVTGAVVGLYNKLRTEKVSKMLRDDYTALSLATLTYSMLFTTARGLGEEKTAEVASRHLRRIPPLVMELNYIIPGVVVSELEKLGFSVDKKVEFEATSDSKEAWSQHQEHRWSV